MADPNPAKFQYGKVRIFEPDEAVTPDGGTEVEEGEPWVEEIPTKEDMSREGLRQRVHRPE